MIGVILVFCFALALSWLITPYVGRLGKRFGALDLPDARKVHSGAVPRLGGAAIFLAFHLALVLALVYGQGDARVEFDTARIFFAFVGGAIIFAVGLVDDLRGLDYRVKFLGQILAASVAYAGGIQIHHIGPFGIAVEFGWLSYPVTVFWFLLFINAVNLSDGLDGLAGGIVFFAAAIMTLFMTVHGDLDMALTFAALGGAVLGFLRYNFNPASIFMGDGGSYFLGYALAAAAVICSVKAEIGALLLIPLVALGVPIFDTLLSPLRRFVVGRGLFSPDKGHVHHRLLEMGLSTQKAVTLVYGMSFILGLLAIAMVSFRSDLRGPFLLALAVGIFIFIRKLRYFEYFTAEKVYGWLIDISDVSGFSQERRSFLSIQMDIAKSAGLEDLWHNIRRAVEAIHFDMAEFTLRKEGSVIANWEWAREAEGRALISDRIMQIRLPLVEELGVYKGTLVIAKDLSRSPLHSYSLRRVETLRRSIKRKLTEMDQADGQAKA